jgi:hypothetical protein
MARPVEYPHARVTTAVRFPPDLHERLRLAALERDLSMNRLVIAAVSELLDRLRPASDFLTDDGRRASWPPPPPPQPDEVPA